VRVSGYQQIISELNTFSLFSAFSPTLTPTFSSSEAPTNTPGCNDNNKCTSDAYDSTKQACVYTPIDCSSQSQYHQCDPGNGLCKPSCPDDGNSCTIVGWNETLKSCYTPVACPANQSCDSTDG
jgi:hypothetical protein